MRRLYFAVGLVILACDAPEGVDEEAGFDVEAGVDEVDEVDEALDIAAVPPGRSCVVAAPAGVVALAASASGVAVAVADTDASVLVHRLRGEGCELVADGALVAAGELLDIDDRGVLYVFPAEAAAPDVVSTMLPGEYPGSMVARVGRDDGVSKLLPAGRGIWGFGVTPAGDGLWVSACGPSGIFSIDGLTVADAMPAPDTLWAQMPGVLADERTFWSVGVRTCDPGQVVTPACGYALVRTTPAGSEDLATTIVDFGAGFEQATLARCGAHVCGVVAGGVTVWDGAGRVVRELSLADALGSPGEAIVEASGAAGGVYVLLRGEAGGRVVFVPLG